jgi:NADPH:quinone reductase-like Zn-dependent oxidoreductase
MAKYGGMLTEMPAILGSDFAGRVVQVGSEVSKVVTGDYVFGLCRLGQVKYSPFQETFLVDEDAAFKLPDAVPPSAAATMGTAVLVRIRLCAAGV